MKSVFQIANKYGRKQNQKKKKRKNFPEAMWSNFYANLISPSLNKREK